MLGGLHPAGTEARRMSEDGIASTSHSPQVYWDEDGWMRCAKCHQCSDTKAPKDLPRCIGHPTWFVPTSHAAYVAAREQSAAVLRQEGERRRAVRLAGREASRAARAAQKAAEVAADSS